MDRIKLPVDRGLTNLRVEKISRAKARLRDLANEVEFDLPTNLLPENIREGDEIALQIQLPSEHEMNHTNFAARLFEEIIN